VLTSSRDLLELGFLVALVAMALWSVWRVQRKPTVSATFRIVAALTSLAAGVGLCFVPYQPNPRLWLIGLPLPLVVFRLEHGSWVDYIVSRNRLLWITVLNVLLTAGVVHAGVALWGRLCRNKASDAP